MTPIGRRLVCSALAVTILVGFLVLLGGCATIGPAMPVAVSDVKSVSGTWEGIVYLPGSERNDVTLTIREDGSFDVVSKKTLGVSSGKGHIVIRDGRLVFEGERGARRRNGASKSWWRGPHEGRRDTRRQQQPVGDALAHALAT